MIFKFIIRIFRLLLYPARRKFYRALHNPQLAQQKVQKAIFPNLINSEYGKSLSITNIEDWQQIPIISYQDIEPWITQQRENKISLLTPEKIKFYEQTSGSSGAAKFIPYTQSLLGSFSQMFCVWAEDLIAHGAKFTTGKIYFCISPVLQSQDEKFQGENRINNDDSEYLDGWLRWFLRPFLVSIPKISGLRSGKEFKHQLALTLLAEDKLEIISIWSPTFLKVILDYIQENREILAQELENKISLQRCQMLQGETINWQDMWTELKLISCWDRVNAADSAAYLRSCFPRVLVQGKGLLATEAPMTIPLIPSQGCVPILDEVFFEFLDTQGNIHLLHELVVGEEYEVIISQKGGLYRYRIGDRLGVSHYYLQTPCLEFLGRTQQISDLVGEKLNSTFVMEVCASLPLDEKSFRAIVPVKYPQEHYLLLLEKIDIDAEIIARKLDIALQASPQYRHARLLGQLQPIRVIVSSKIPEIITNYQISCGKRWGDLKHEILMTKPIPRDLLIEIEKLVNK
ncbi:GH3 family domain-containing protein [Calothrix sp. 336/3]|uniref:GH3 family domain-containing protein n=1 Tax=Calothrix sp. 336/3 TaxID=1337936 RepID=UPI0004E37903|nr:GH3 auxin-responsive promoter family protein [Calothrix sp. 336/3]AKG21946.1 GH3 auxin-responsive promoter [Calothrix sp. 336/3]